MNNMGTNNYDIRENYMEWTNTVDDYRDKWICDESLLRILTSHYPNLKGTTRKSLNTQLGKLAGSFDASNTNLVYYAQFKVCCPVEPTSRRNVSFWYRGSNDKPIPPKPTASTDVACAFANVPSVRRDTVRTTSTTRDLLNSQKQNATPPPAPLRSGNERSDPTTQPKKKRTKQANVVDETPRDKSNGTTTTPNDTNKVSPENKNSDDTNNNDNGNNGPNNDSGESPAGGGVGGNNSGGEVQSVDNRIPIYWESREAANTFGFDYDAGDDVYAGLVDRVEVLTKSIQKYKGYRDIVTHNGAQLSEFALFNIRNKGIYLRKAYEIALKKMGRYDERYGKYVMCFIKVCCQEDQQISHKRIEYMVRQIKSHRAALDFDKEFIMKSVTASGFEFKEEVEFVGKGKTAGSKRKR